MASQWQSPGTFPYLLRGVTRSGPGDQQLCDSQAEGQHWGLQIMSNISNSCLCFKASYCQLGPGDKPLIK